MSDQREERCADGWICEQHPANTWPHDDCSGPGMLCTPLQQREEYWLSYVANLREDAAVALREAQAEIERLKAQHAEQHRAWDDENEKRCDAEEALTTVQDAISEVVEQIDQARQRALLDMTGSRHLHDLTAWVDRLRTLIPRAPDQP